MNFFNELSQTFIHELLNRSIDINYNYLNPAQLVGGYVYFINIHDQNLRLMIMRFYETRKGKKDRK